MKFRRFCTVFLLLALLLTQLWPVTAYAVEDIQLAAKAALLVDGATGTELQKRGYTGDVCAEQWTLDHPDAIIDIQRGYVAAGSQVVSTPTYGDNRSKLEESGLKNCTTNYKRRQAEQ